MLVRALHVRGGPGTSYPILRDLTNGDVVQLLDVISQEEAWIKIGEDQWCAMAYNGCQLMKKVV